MNIYSLSEARRKLTMVLEEAQYEGAVRIRRRDGTEFEIVPVHSQASPLNVQGVELGLSAEELFWQYGRDVRERSANSWTLEESDCFIASMVVALVWVLLVEITP
jgi:hypothetical protein